MPLPDCRALLQSWSMNLSGLHRLQVKRISTDQESKSAIGEEQENSLPVVIWVFNWEAGYTVVPFPMRKVRSGRVTLQLKYQLMPASVVTLWEPGTPEQ